MTDLKREGLKLITDTMSRYRSMIEKAPTRNSYNRFTGKFDESKNNLRRAKTDAIRDIVQVYALLGVELLSSDELKALDE